MDPITGIESASFTAFHKVHGFGKVIPLNIFPTILPNQDRSWLPAAADYLNRHVQVYQIVRQSAR